MAEENENTFQLSQDNKEYILSTSLVGDKVRFTCEEETTDDDNPTYTKDFSLEDLIKINRLFFIIPTIQEAQEELDKGIEKQKIGIKQPDKENLEIIFYMMIGTEKINFSLPLPKKVLDKQEMDDLKKSHLHSVNTKELPAHTGFDPYENRPRCSCPLDDHRLDKLEDNAFAIKSEHEKLKSDINRLVSELTNQRRTNEKLKKQLESFNESDKEELVKLRAENNDLKKQLEELKLKDQDEINQLNIIVSDLRSENDSLKERIFELEEISKNLENDLLNERENKNKLKTIKKPFPAPRESTGMDSSHIVVKDQPRTISVKGEIIHDKKEVEFLSKKINKKNKKITFNILYKATVDSDKAAAFHEKCDSAQNTLVLIETDKGKRFGGYTTVGWTGDCIDKKDENAFIFSLDKKKIYENIKDEDAIGCYPKFGPIFLGCQIKIFDNFFEKGGATFEKGLNYQTEEDFELNGGEQNFNVKELEVYQIIVE